MTKPTWVFTAGTYRTASTTHYHMTRDVVEAANAGYSIGYHNERRLKDFDGLDLGDLEAVKELYAHHEIECPFDEPPTFSRSPHYIVCKVFKYLPKGFRDDPSHGQILHRQGRVKAVISIRDPRDIITSQRERDRQREVEFDDEKFEYVATQEMPEWLADLEKWIDLGPDITLVSKFEDFTTNLYREVRRIAAHLDLELDNDVAKGIARNYTVEALKRRKKEFWEKRADNPDLREDPALPSVPALLFASSGQWREKLTEEEAEMVYRANKKFFERFGYDK
ncbi:MAG: hypothetical protein GTO15_11130 [Pseudomonas stutzeri]|nr:hypothetical protein [Stutzerimonas stutzeri]